MNQPASKLPTGIDRAVDDLQIRIREIQQQQRALEQENSELRARNVILANALEEATDALQGQEESHV